MLNDLIDVKLVTIETKWYRFAEHLYYKNNIPSYVLLSMKNYGLSPDSHSIFPWNVIYFEHFPGAGTQHFKMLY